MSENKNEFKGDVELVTKGGEFDIVTEEGLVKDCQNFDTAVLLSLFGGNCGDVNGKEKETWWGNLIPETKEEERIQAEIVRLSKELAAQEAAASGGSPQSNPGGYIWPVDSR